ncbi:MAG: hypothetical protein Q9161_001961 [Pseudevernia consocians]
MRSTGNPEKTGTSSGLGRPFTKRSGKNSIPETWNDFNHSSELKGAYINLDKYKTQSPKSAGTNGITPTPANGPATRREDLESWQRVQRCWIRGKKCSGVESFALITSGRALQRTEMTGKVLEFKFGGPREDF